MAELRASSKTFSTLSSLSKTTSLVRRDRSLPPSLPLLSSREKEDRVPSLSLLLLLLLFPSASGRVREKPACSHGWCGRQVAFPRVQ